MSIKISVITSLYRCENYLRSFLNHYAQIINLEECELILVHNDPAPVEKSILAEYQNRIPNLLVIDANRESLYSSWNRGVRACRGKYVAIWNVDDIRLPDSLYEQAIALDTDPGAALVYGQFIITDAYGATTGTHISGPDVPSKEHVYHKRFHISCFPMWRKTIHELIGYFDEQLRLVGDFDFQIRVAKRFRIKKLDKNMGYFLRGTSVNLSSNSKLQDTELTAIHLRHGNYDLLNITRVMAAMKLIRINKLKWNGAYYDSHLFQGGARLPWRKKAHLFFVPFWYMPRHVLRAIKRYSFLTKFLPARPLK